MTSLLAMTLDATVGGSQANSYVTVEEADAFFASSLFASRWDVLDPATREAALRQAATWLDTLTFKGAPAYPSSDDPGLPQALQWPRTGVTCKGVTADAGFIPKEIKQAQVMLALPIAEDPTALFSGSRLDDTSFVTKERVDVLEQQYGAKPDQLIIREASKPWVLRAFPWLADILGCWITVNSRTVRLYRN